MTTLRLGSALFGGFILSDMWRARDRDPEIWIPATSWMIYMTFNGGLFAANVFNLVWPSLGMLQVVVLVILTSPAAIFLNFVAEIGSKRKTVEN